MVDIVVEIWPVRLLATLEFPRHVHRLRSNDRSTDLSHAADYTTPDTATYPVTRYLPLSFLISSFWPRSFSCLLTRAPSYTTQLNASTRVQTRSIEFSSRDRFFRLRFIVSRITFCNFGNATFNSILESKNIPRCARGLTFIDRATAGF